MSQKKHDTGYTFMSIVYQAANSQTMISKQHALFKNTPVIYSSINYSMDISIKYGFRGYHYLKSKVVLLPSSLTNMVCFEIGCSITLCDIIFFCTQVPNILI